MLVGIYQNNVCLAIVAAALLNFFLHDSNFGWRVSLGHETASLAAMCRHAGGHGPLGAAGALLRV